MSFPNRARRGGTKDPHAWLPPPSPKGPSALQRLTMSRRPVLADAASVIAIQAWEVMEVIMGGFRRSGEGRGLEEVDIALRLTAAWAVVAVVSFLPRQQANLTLLGVSTAILLLVWAVAIVSLRVRLGRRKTLEELQRLSPTEFEDWVAARFRELGYRVKTTGTSGDHGADLLVEKPGELAIVQCKRYRTWSVGEPVLRDLFGAMHDFGAQRAYLVTTGELTAAARAWARGKPIAIWDGKHLARLAKGAPPEAPEPHAASPEAGSQAVAAPAEEAGSGPALRQATCPHCGAALVLRRNRQTGEPFLGCSRFPQCRFTRRV